MCMDRWLRHLNLMGLHVWILTDMIHERATNGFSYSQTVSSLSPLLKVLCEEFFLEVGGKKVSQTHHFNVNFHFQHHVPFISTASFSTPAHFPCPVSTLLWKFKPALFNAARSVHFKIPEFTVLLYSEQAEINLTREGAGGGGGGSEIHSLRENIQDKHSQV